jgi:cell division protease FtsH
VTIIPRGQAMGATFSLPEKDRYGYGRRFIEAELRRLCGGRVAEETKTGDMTSGAAMDIRMATQYARHMVLQWGMSDRLGFVDYATEENASSLLPEKGYSEDTGAVIDAEIKRIIDEAYEDAKKLISENWQKVAALAEALLKHETLSADEAHQVIEGKPLHKPSVSELLEKEAAKSASPQPDPAPPRPGSHSADDPSGPDALPSPA